jgi:hypothetical protein
MARQAIAIAALVLASLDAWGQDPSNLQIPQQGTKGAYVAVTLPSDIPSESIQIAYQLVGPFGGFSSYAKQIAGANSYRIFTTVGGKKAKRARIVVFTPTCEPQQFDVPLPATAQAHVEFRCQPAATVMLSGKISPPGLARRDNAVVEVWYEADWVGDFFEILDGPGTQFRFATVPSAPDGSFRVRLPVFARDSQDHSDLPRAAFWLRLIDSRTGNGFADYLVPERSEFGTPEHWLRIRTEYPDGLKFVPAP